MKSFRDSVIFEEISAVTDNEKSAVMRPPADYDGAETRMPAEAEERDPRAPAMMICARLAGRAIIRVVSRCEDAQENSQLGT